jgi:hypothetical protein
MGTMERSTMLNTTHLLKGKQLKKIIPEFESNNSFMVRLLPFYFFLDI